jgi:hypothetical protein
VGRDDHRRGVLGVHCRLDFGHRLLTVFAEIARMRTKLAPSSARIGCEGRPIHDVLGRSIKHASPFPPFLLKLTGNGKQQI